MTLTNQRDAKFTKLLERVFPYGIESEKLRTMKEVRLAVRAQIFRFACNEKFHIHCSCESCTEDRYIEVWDLAEALTAERPIDCACGQGSFVPIYKNRLVG
ncbi:MAG: hypothetical protein FWE12_08690 [Oscillospiraceae bacterium]|nr:hypothetical protein [Oscillospiraceae bacterium]